MKRAYTFDDVALVPQYNNVPSRTEPSLNSWMSRDVQVDLPIIPANMDTVIGSDLANLLIARGGRPIFHRFTDTNQQMRWVKEFGSNAFISCGINHLDQALELLDSDVLGVCIDVAHGHSTKMLHLITELKKARPNKQIIAGNICTPMAYHDLVNAGADAVKVGIGPGAACTTRIKTGFGVPQFTAIRLCAEVADRLRVPLIADGGIRTSRDVVLALAAGASTVMIGKLFALTEESAATKRNNPQTGAREAHYRGQASASFQNDFYGRVKEKTCAEGVDFWAPVTGSANKVLDELLGGIRSGLTYGGARSIKELQRKAEFVEVTASYIRESYPRV